MREVDRMDILLDSYYAPIRLPDDNRYALKRALYDLLMEKMPKKVSEDGLTDGQMMQRVGFNRGIDESVSAINQLFGREE